MDDPLHLGFTLTGFHDSRLDALPIGQRHDSEGHPDIAPVHRHLVHASKRLGWQAGIFHSGDGYMDYLIWRPIRAPYEIPARIADLATDPSAGSAMAGLGLTDETFLIIHASPDQGWRPDQLHGIDVALDEEDHERVQSAWTSQLLFAQTPDMATLGAELAEVAHAMRLRAFDGIEPGPGRSMIDTMFDL